MAHPNTRHGEAIHGQETKEYRAWEGMNRRCYETTNPSYERYGAVGTRVCDRWRYSFEAFLEDMGRAPTSAHTIDRISGTEHYTPDNCRWATKKEQARNRRTMISAIVYLTTRRNK